MFFLVRFYVLRKKIIGFILILSFCFPFSVVIASNKPNPWPEIWKAHPFYIGVFGGYGNTDWSQLVARYNDQFEYFLLSVSVPVSATDQGATWGFVTGWEVQPHFALEMSYARFPNTNVSFDQYSIYGSRYNVYSLESNTYAYDFVGKFMVQIEHTGIRGFANAGGAVVHRHDILVDTSHICPTFGVGLNYVLVQHLLMELGFQYYAGFDKADVTPAVNYIPFLYSVTLKLAYRF